MVQWLAAAAAADVLTDASSVASHHLSFFWRHMRGISIFMTGDSAHAVVSCATVGNSSVGRQQQSGVAACAVCTSFRWEPAGDEAPAVRHCRGTHADFEGVQKQECLLVRRASIGQLVP